MRKVLSSFLCTLILLSVCFPLPAAAATAPVTDADAVTTGTKIFDGYNLAVLDQAAPAAGMRGRPDDRTVMCFVSAYDREVGVIAYSDYLSIIEKIKKMIVYPDGSSLAAPPDGRASWNEWFADEYNKLRGLVAGSREAAVAAETASTMDETAKTIEEYRQEVIRLVNEERENAGLPALYEDDNAMNYAQERAREIVTSFSHARPDGKEKPYDELGAMNENIARKQKTPEEVVEDWMNSPSHRANILNQDAFAIGVGCYSSGKTLYWVQEFLW